MLIKPEHLATTKSATRTGKRRTSIRSGKKMGFRIGENGKIELSLGLLNGKRQKPIGVRVKELPPGKIKEIELIYDRGLKLAIAYDDGKSAKGNNHHRSKAAQSETVKEQEI